MSKYRRKRQLIKSCRTIFMLSAWLALAGFMQGICAGDEQPMINGHPITPEFYQMMLEHKFLPTRTTFLSDEEIAQKLDMSLPQCADIKAAMEKRDAPALTRALAAYLNTRLPPFPIPHPDFVPQADQYRRNADPWLGSEINWKVGAGYEVTYPIGEGINWYSNVEHNDGDRVAGFHNMPMLYHLGCAYISTGEPKYAEGIVMYTRSFYKNARPPAQRPTSWSGSLGPWAVGGHNRVSGSYLPWAYRAIGRSDVVPDADRVMFLKMFWEHTDFMYLFAEAHTPHNFETQLNRELLIMALTFPEFRESSAWRERCIERLTQTIQEAILEDGGSHERTGYHFSYMGPVADCYRKLRDFSHPVPESFRRALEPVFDWGMWILSPTLQYPNLGLGSPVSMLGEMQHALVLFPERREFAYLVSGGKEGSPPERTARVFPQTGFLTMRSDWSRNALYMAMNYNSSLFAIVTHPDLLSFGLWAHGRAYMTNCGSPLSYGHPRCKSWCMHTQSSNTVLVDKESQDYISTGRWLENWQSLPVRYLPDDNQSSGGTGFDYLVAVSDAYSKFHVRHRRAVLFVKPRYWLVYDLLSPTDKTGNVHEYRWQGHFQPTELTIDSHTKRVSTGVEDGKCLYVLPLNLESLELERGTGVIAIPTGAGDGPYVHFVRKTNQPASFTVLLYPTVNNASPPQLEPLAVKAGGKTMPNEEAIGCLVRDGETEDVIAIAQTQGLRTYGIIMSTDGEAAYLQTKNNQVIEAGLVGGHNIEYQGRQILKLGDGIASAHVRWTGETVELNTRGSGKLSIASGSAKKLLLNGHLQSAKQTGWWGKNRWEIELQGTGEVSLSQPVFSTDREELWKAVVGTPPPENLSDVAQMWKSVLVAWKTSLPSDAWIEYKSSGGDTNTYERLVNPEPTVEHKLVLGPLKPGTTYKLRITCRTDDGRVGKVEMDYKQKQEE